MRLLYSYSLTSSSTPALIYSPGVLVVTAGEPYSFKSAISSLRILPENLENSWGICTRTCESSSSASPVCCNMTLSRRSPRSNSYVSLTDEPSSAASSCLTITLSSSSRSTGAFPPCILPSISTPSPCISMLAKRSVSSMNSFAATVTRRTSPTLLLSLSPLPMLLVVSWKAAPVPAGAMVSIR